MTGTYSIEGTVDKHFRESMQSLLPVFSRHSSYYSVNGGLDCGVRKVILEEYKQLCLVRQVDRLVR